MGCGGSRLLVCPCLGPTPERRGSRSAGRSLEFAAATVRATGDVSLATAQGDAAYFNYTDYEHNALRMLRFASAGMWRPADRGSRCLTELRIRGRRAPEPLCAVRAGAAVGVASRSTSRPDGFRRSSAPSRGARTARQPAHRLAARLSVPDVAAPRCRPGARRTICWPCGLAAGSRRFAVGTGARRPACRSSPPIDGTPASRRTRRPIASRRRRGHDGHAVEPAASATTTTGVSSPAVSLETGRRASWSARPRRAAVRRLNGRRRTASAVPAGALQAGRVGRRRRVLARLLDRRGREIVSRWNIPSSAIRRSTARARDSRRSSRTAIASRRDSSRPRARRPHVLENPG